jgi:hypothetical protein
LVCQSAFFPAGQNSISYFRSATANNLSLVISVPFDPRRREKNDGLLPGELFAALRAIKKALPVTIQARQDPHCPVYIKSLNPKLIA